VTTSDSHYAKIGPFHDVSDCMAALQILDSVREAEQGDLIPVLQEVQRHYGYLPQDVLLEISEHTKIPVSRIFGVATF